MKIEDKMSRAMVYVIMCIINVISKQESEKLRDLYDQRYGSTRLTRPVVLWGLD